MKIFTLLALFLSSFIYASAQDAPQWLRYPAISPDGQTLLFEYKGDIWSVPTAGGNAIPMTLSESYEFSPVWSHDGKSIAFASDRYGNFDVFVMPGSVMNAPNYFRISLTASDAMVERALPGFRDALRG